MRPLLYFALLTLSSGPSLAVSHKDWDYTVKEEIKLPRGWDKHSRPPPEHSITLRIGLPQSNFEDLERHLYEVSDPDHDRYGQHLSKAEVDALVAPHPDSIVAVDEWLSSFGVTEADITRSSAKDWVTLTVPIGLAEKMLETEYHVYQHGPSSDFLVRTTRYSLPSSLHEHVDVIQPTTMFGRFKPNKNTHIFDPEAVEFETARTNQIVTASTGADVPANCAQNITLTCLRQLYNAVGYTPANLTKNSIGITGYLEEYANLQDLKSFYLDQRPEAANSTYKYVSIKGGQNDQNLTEAGAEAGLDVQFAFGLSYPIDSTFYSTAGSPPFIPDTTTPTNTNEPYTDWLDYVLSHPHPPLSISTSYGDDEQTVPKSYAKRACAGFAQLGARGVSVLFSSGDGGVGDGDSDPATQQCFTNDGRNATRFIPAFPASCPYVTSVGGTTGLDPERAVDRFYSGGGFSDYFARPPYQQKAVGVYLSKLPKGLYKGLYNPAGRGIPDVAAQGDFYRIFYQGRAVRIGGTSASSPAFAGFVALLNDARIKAKKPPLGFLNPFIYSKGYKGLNDVTIGKNAGCGTEGFNATEGWDPVTGYGTPNFGKLKELVLR